MIEPMATTVAGPEPEIAAKKIQARTPEIPSPPGIQPTSELMKAISRLAMAPLVMMVPARTKNGIASRIKLSSELNSCSTTAWVGVKEKK